MMQFISRWISSVVIVVASAAFLEMLLPAGTLRKFSRFVIGLVVIVTLLAPLMQLAGAPGYFYLPELELEMGADVEQAIANGESMVQEGQEYMWRELQDQAENQVRGLLNLIDGVEDAEVVAQVNGDGTLQRVLVKIRTARQKALAENRHSPGSVEPVPAVAPVKVNQPGSGGSVLAVSSKKQQREADRERDQVARRVKDFLTQFYGLTPDRITVSFVD